MGRELEGARTAGRQTADQRKTAQDAGNKAVDAKNESEHGTEDQAYGA
jgi:hypothetical protein